MIQIAAFQMRVTQVRTFQMAIAQLCPFQISIAEVRSFQMRSLEVCAFEIGALKSRALKKNILPGVLFAPLVPLCRVLHLRAAQQYLVLLGV